MHQFSFHFSFHFNLIGWQQSNEMSVSNLICRLAAMPLSVAGQLDLRIGVWLATSQSDEIGMKRGTKSGMKTDANRRALLLTPSSIISGFYWYVDDRMQLIDYNVPLIVVYPGFAQTCKSGFESPSNWFNISIFLHIDWRLLVNIQGNWETIFFSDSFLIFAKVKLTFLLS